MPKDLIFELYRAIVFFRRVYHQNALRINQMGINMSKKILRFELDIPDVVLEAVYNHAPKSMSRSQIHAQIFKHGLSFCSSGFNDFNQISNMISSLSVTDENISLSQAEKKQLIKFLLTMLNAFKPIEEISESEEGK